MKKFNVIPKSKDRSEFTVTAATVIQSTAESLLVFQNDKGEPVAIVNPDEILGVVEETSRN